MFTTFEGYIKNMWYEEKKLSTIRLNTEANGNQENIKFETSYETTND